MRNLTKIRPIRSPAFIAGAVMAVALTMLFVTSTPGVAAQETPLEQPGLTNLRCQKNGIAMSWHTENNGEAPAPDGWKVERRYLTPDGLVLETFTFIGADADALQTVTEGRWDWVDTSAAENVDYIYRVRAINSDRSPTEDRTWSREVSVSCLEGPLNQPGISVPQCLCDEVGIYWHTKDRGSAPAPDGWKVERRHRESEQWITETFTFIGGDADALQTFNEVYWDWFDKDAEPRIDYTYRVRAINADGSDMVDRVWSRRAPVLCETLG